MRHQKHRSRLSRPSGARKALMRNLSVALLTNERIVTTVPKAKALRRVVEPLITLGKKGDLAARRRAMQILPNKKAVQKLFNELALEYSERDGGYTRILRLPPRHGDAAPMAIIELVGYREKKEREDAQAAESGKKKAKKGLRQRIKDKVMKEKKEEGTPEEEFDGLQEKAAESEEAVPGDDISAEAAPDDAATPEEKK